MSTETPGGGLVPEEPEKPVEPANWHPTDLEGTDDDTPSGKRRKPKVKPANWHPTGVGEIGDGPGPVAPGGEIVSPLDDPAQPPVPKPDNWHPTGDDPAGPSAPPGPANWHPTGRAGGLGETAPGQDGPTEGGVPADGAKQGDPPKPDNWHPTGGPAQP